MTVAQRGTGSTHGTATWPAHAQSEGPTILYTQECIPALLCKPSHSSSRGVAVYSYSEISSEDRFHRLSISMTTMLEFLIGNDVEFA